MKLHTVFITYNRLELTERALRSYFETVSVPFHVTVIDNGSEWEAVKWLSWHAAGAKYGMNYALGIMGENLYPGAATNYGWEWETADNDTHLQRADNDHIFLPGWCEEVERMFQNPKIGQLGLRTAAEELNARTNTGGNCIIPRALWDKGLRWDERTWPELRDQLGPGFTEDSLMSPAVLKMGYTWTRVKKPCIQPISPETPDDPDRPYYEQTWRDRGIHEHLIRSGS